MNIKEIEYEIAKWEDMSFLEKIKKELCDYVNELDKIISRRYRKIIQEMVPAQKSEALKILQFKKLFDDNMNYIGNTDIVEFNEEKKITNGGYLKGKILVNPHSAKQFYASYIDFAMGKLEGIRSLDYSKALSELNDLSSLEILYWYYFNKKTYQDFLKSTMLHEDVHRWTLNPSLVDNQIDILAMEGLVEKEARSIARENDLEYAKCFRNDELLLIDYLENGIASETENAMLMLFYGNPEECLIFAIKLKLFMMFGDKSLTRVEQLAKDIYLSLGNNVANNNVNSFGKNYREIFGKMKLNKSEEIIKFIEAEIAKNRELNGVQTNSQPSERR